ncbi:BTAD domain-containing putative transcriptional regulator [Phytomonospora sp. NPDC050363]|uniref:BTAD domain-containing putative transcriptional regulator n=1 Tax=Phytomonospora sp. NPDC050363 TaxID=3155642 RepID=UPI0033F0E618
MRFGVLGPVTAWTGDGEPVAIPERKVRALLAILLTDPGRTVSTDRLIDELWPAEPPAKPANALQRKVSELRKALDAAEPGARELVAHRPPGYLLRADPADTDAGRFTTALARARRATTPAARAHLTEQALDLWRGPAYADFADENFTRADTVRLADARLEAAELLAETRLELGDHAQAVAELTELAARHPARGRLRAAHMRALYHSGRRTEAVEAYAAHRRHLAELGLDPDPELADLHRAMLRQDLPEPPRPQVAGDHLPRPVAELIGRDTALAEVVGHLATARLVTLTGPGGVGKTRLALEAAHRVRDDHPDGVWTVELAALPAGDGPEAQDAVAEAVMAVLRVGEYGTTGPLPASVPVTPLERLSRAVRDRDMLLLLDNCEHLVGPAALLSARLLRDAPGLRVLATSQQPLAAGGEVRYPVPPLALPDTDTGVAESGAVRLFTERVAATVPGFSVTEDNSAEVAAICRRLDGIPLALELAAPRVRVLGTTGLLERLDDRFGLLTDGYRDAPDRQKTLRAMIDWSYWLLTPDERTVLRRLSVHADGCTLDAAEEVCADADIAGGAILGLLAGLVDRSLVAVTPSGPEPRFRLLESVAAYSAERLEEAGEAEHLRAKHAEYYARLAEQARPHLHGHGQRRWLARLDAETANLRAAIELDGDPDRTMRLVDALVWYWSLRGRFSEADRSLTLALARMPDSECPAACRATAWRWGVRRLRGVSGEQTRAAAPTEAPPEADMDGRSDWFLSYALMETVEYETGARLVERALKGARAEGDDWGIAAALALRAVQRFGSGDLTEALADAAESLALFERLGDAWGQLRAIYPLASHAEVTGDYARAERLHTRGLAAAEELALWREASDRLCGLGRVALLRGDLDASRRLHEQALHRAVEHRHHNGEVSAEIGLGLTARRAGRLDEAETRLRRVLDYGREYDFLPITTLMLAELGFVAELRGDVASARDLHRRGLAEARRLEDSRSIALALEGSAGAEVLAGEYRTTARLLGTAAALRERAGTPLPSGERGDVVRIGDSARRALGARDFDAEMARGRELPAGWFGGAADV